MHRPIDEAHIPQVDLAYGELLLAADDQPVRGRVHAHHVPGPRLGEVAEATSLPHRVERGAAMGAELAPARVDDRAGMDGKPVRKVARRFSARHKTDLLALGFVR